MGAVVMVLSLKPAALGAGLLLVQPAEGGGLSVSGAGGAHELHVARTISAAIISSTPGDYLEPGHEYFSLSDEQLLGRFMPAFKKFNPAFEPDWIKKVWVFRTNYAQPVPLLNHSKNIPAIQTPIEGLYFASMSQVYPWDRGTNFAVEIGRRAARLILNSAPQSR